MDTKRSKLLFQKAKEHLVGGVNSPVRAFGSVGGDPLFIDRGEGAYIIDVDGNRYIDYVGSFGPLLLGHCHPEVTGAIQSAAEKGTTFGATTEMEIKVAELVKKGFPAIEKVRFVNSGTEAVMSALRLARAFTGKNKIIKFAGGYHGHVDFLLVQAGSGLATFGLPGSKGVSASSVKDTLVAEFNDIDGVRKLFNEYPDDIAAIIVEPVTGNMGVTEPANDFLKKLKTLTLEHNSLLVIDEVMTGFRHHFGGAQDVFDVQGDITCLGKVIGGGLPVGAYGGRTEIMSMVSPEGPVYQAGTLSGNPLAMTAGYHMLRILSENPEYYERLNKNTSDLATGIRNALKEKGIPGVVNNFGSMANPFFTELEQVSSYADARTCDTERFGKFFRGLLDNGIYIPPSQFESWFVSVAHEEEHIQRTLEVIRKVLGTL